MKLKIDWAGKLSSRKFWMALATFLTGLILLFGGSDSAASQASGVIMSLGSLAAYILGEGWVDAARLRSADSSDSHKED